MSSKGKATTEAGGETALMPKRRFPEFQDAPAWELVSLRRASIPVDERVGERKLTPVSISAGIGFVPQAEKFGRDISGNQYQLYTLVRDGDFVFNKGNSLKFPQGCIYLLQGWGQVAAPNVFIAFRLKRGYSNGFFQNCFEQNQHGKQLKKHITSGARSNGLLNISKETFFNVEIPAPSLPEQQKIADCLKSADALIEAQKWKVKALRAHKKGLMQRLFPQEGETQPRLRFPEFKGGGEWQYATLEDLLALPATYGIVTAGSFQSQGVPMLRGGDIKDGQVGTGAPLVAQEISLQYKRTILKGDDVVIALVGYPGEAAVVPPRYVGANISRAVGLLRLKDRRSAHFLAFYLNSPAGRRTVLKPSAGSAQVVVNLKALNALVLPIAESAEQHRIADCLTSLDDLIAAETEKLDNLKNHKKGLMQQLFPQFGEAGA